MYTNVFDFELKKPTVSPFRLASYKHKCIFPSSPSTKFLNKKYQKTDTQALFKSIIYVYSPYDGRYTASFSISSLLYYLPGIKSV